MSSTEDIVDRVEQQFNAYEELGLMSNRRFEGEDGRVYRQPSRTRVAQLVAKYRAVIKGKREHGFTEIVVSLGIPMPLIVEALDTVIYCESMGGELKSARGETVGPDHTGVNSCVRFYGRLYPVKPGLWCYWHNGWVTRGEFYHDQPLPGAHIAMVRPDDDAMPREGGEGAAGDRPNLPCGINAWDARRLLGTAPYDHEAPLTLDQALFRILHRVYGGMIMPYNLGDKFGTMALCARTARGVQQKTVPTVYWNQGARVLELQRTPRYDASLLMALPAAVGLE